MIAQRASAGWAACGLAVFLFASAGGCVTDPESKRQADETKHVEPVIEPQTGAAAQPSSAQKPSPTEPKPAPAKAAEKS